jgi:hypothetical protein
MHFPNNSTGIYLGSLQTSRFSLNLRSARDSLLKTLQNYAFKESQIIKIKI